MKNIHWKTFDQISLSAIEWKSKAPPKAFLIALPGMNGTAETLEPLGRTLQQYDITTIALDLRGQAKDPRPNLRGDIESIEFIFRDIKQQFDCVASQSPNTPIFLCGESMGSLIAIHLAASSWQPEQLKGLILLAPVPAINNPVGPLKFALLKTLYRIKPTFKLKIATHAESKNANQGRIAGNEAYQLEFDASPLRIKKFTIRYYYKIHYLVTNASNVARSLNVSTLLIHGGNDYFITDEKVAAWFEEIASTDKTRAYFPEGYHLLLHDACTQAVIQKIRDWIKARIDN